MTTGLPPYLQAGDKVILFDGVCRLCNGWVRFIIRHDRDLRFKLCAVQSSEGQAMLKWFGLPTDRFETMILVEDGEAYGKTEAFLRIVRRLPKPWSLLRSLHLVPRPLRDWCYDFVASRRYRLFGRYDHCMIPARRDRKRFIGSD